MRPGPVKNWEDGLGLVASFKVATTIIAQPAKQEVRRPNQKALSGTSPLRDRPTANPSAPA